MRDRLIGPQAKIERAQKHIQDFNVARGDFIGNAYRVLREEDPKTRDLVYRVSAESHAPERLRGLALVIGDAVHNLRSALDLLAWQLVEANGGTPTRWTSFPIADSPNEFESGGPNKIKGASEEAVELLRRVRPYKGGYDALWRLHRLDATDKHRILLTVGTSHQATEFVYPLGRTTFGPITLKVRRPKTVVDGEEIYRVAAAYRESTEKQPEPKFAFDVAFAEPGIVNGEAVIPTIHQLVSVVQGVLKLFAPLFDPLDPEPHVGSLPF